MESSVSQKDDCLQVNDKKGSRDHLYPTFLKSSLISSHSLFIHPTWSMVTVRLRENWLCISIVTLKERDFFQFLAEVKSLGTTELEHRNDRITNEEEILQNK